jgi:DNA-binding winged helix-turn-helix (wHTH) protein
LSTEYLQGFYLGEVFVEPLKGQVSGRNATGHLSPKAVEVLLCLARTPGELVTRETLLDEAWGHGEGSAEALSHAVSEIRHALGDHAEKPVFIQTIPKRIINTNKNVADLDLFDNLRQRGVLETALAYLIFGWLLIQIADIVFDQLHLPPWAGTFVTTG